MLCIKEAQFLLTSEHVDHEVSPISCITLNNYVLRYSIFRNTSINGTESDVCAGVIIILLRKDQSVTGCRECVDELIDLSDIKVCMDIWIVEYPVATPDIECNSYSPSEPGAFVPVPGAPVGVSEARNAFSLLLDMEVRPRYLPETVLNLVVLDADDKELPQGIKSKQMGSVVTISTGASIAAHIPVKEDKISAYFSTFPRVLGLSSWAWTGIFWSFLFEVQALLYRMWHPLLIFPLPSPSPDIAQATKGDESGWPHTHRASADASGIVVECGDPAASSVSSGQSCAHSHSHRFEFRADATVAAKFSGVAGVLYAVLTFSGRAASTGVGAADVGPQHVGCSSGCVGSYRCSGDSERQLTLWVWVQGALLSERTLAGHCLIPLLVPAPSSHSGPVSATSVVINDLSNASQPVPGVAAAAVVLPGTLEGAQEGAQFCNPCAFPPATVTARNASAGTRRQGGASKLGIGIGK